MTEIKVIHGYDWDSYMYVSVPIFVYKHYGHFVEVILYLVVLYLKSISYNVNLLNIIIKKTLYYDGKYY